MTTIASAPPCVNTPLLRVRDLRKEFKVRLGFCKAGVVSAVDGVSFSIAAGQTLGIVGESGCGKSTTARLLLGLLDADGGTVEFEGREVSWSNRLARQRLRRSMQMVFQDPYSSLNPRMSIRENIGFPM
ncbi:MAG TPA: ATP-binding cassette domain-containing protein, partial [Streptosporangiaceae bacterium]|nr:ATP-binding cassette domain-containing protein [Streptosporangiaceae bacterium]